MPATGGILSKRQKGYAEMNPLYWQTSFEFVSLFTIASFSFAVYLTWHLRQMEKIRLKSKLLDNEMELEQLKRLYKEMVKELMERRDIESQYIGGLDKTLKELEIRSQPNDRQGTKAISDEQNSADNQGLRTEVLEFRDTTSQFAVSFDKARTAGSADPTVGIITQRCRRRIHSS